MKGANYTPFQDVQNFRKRTQELFRFVKSQFLLLSKKDLEEHKKKELEKTEQWNHKEKVSSRSTRIENRK